MSHDKIRDAARARMAETGEPYAAARRTVMAEHGAGGREWFEISYSRAGLDKMTAWADAVLFRVGPGVSGVDVSSGEVRIRMGSFKLDIPRGSIRSVRPSRENVRGSTGVHHRRGRWLVNGATEGLVEIAIDPPLYVERGIDSPFRRARVDVLTVSLVDPDGLIAALTARR
jgi:hypothetical protein